MFLVRVLKLTAIIDVLFAVGFLLASAFAQTIAARIGLSGCALTLLLASIALLITAHRSGDRSAYPLVYPAHF